MSTDPKMTPWFVNGEKPARPDVYNVSSRKGGQSGKWWARWDGSTWYCADKDKEFASRETNPVTPADYWHDEGSWRAYVAAKATGEAS